MREDARQPDDPAPSSAPRPLPGPGVLARLRGGLKPVSRRSALRLAAQGLGFAVGLGLLAWAVSLALSEKNRASLEMIWGGERTMVLWLLVLSMVSVLLNGVMFWVVLRPLKTLHIVDVALTNAIAAFLSVLPFKINLLTRLLIHHRRDGVSFKDILSWLGAMTALAFSVLVPVGLAGVWRGTMDALWWMTAVGGSVALGGLGVWLGHLAVRFKVLQVLSLGSDRIARHWPTVFSHMLLRWFDVALLCMRFLAAAQAAHVELPLEKVVLLATTYFLLSVFAPAGALGFREMGTAGVGVAAGAATEEVVLVTLVVTAVELVASGLLCVPAFLRLRPDRLVRGR
ncbi:MAG: lysylphosphatidylglycerol synthase domain-containing protein [Phycisphaerales bacterium]